MFEFDDFIARLETDDSVMTNSVLLAAEAAWDAQFGTAASVYDYGLAAVSALPLNATPFEKGLACAFSMMLATEDLYKPTTRKGMLTMDG